MWVCLSGSSVVLVSVCLSGVAGARGGWGWGLGWPGRAILNPAGRDTTTPPGAPAIPPKHHTAATAPTKKHAVHRHGKKKRTLGEIWSRLF